MEFFEKKYFSLLIISLVSFFWFWFFVSGAQKFTSGVWTAPLDDTFIHFQYAKQIAQGQWFQYYPDEPITTGGTSFLYPIILAVGYKLGFTGLKLLWWAYGLAVICLIASGQVIFLLAQRYRLPRWAAFWTALLVVSSGWLLWGYFSGMEIALQSTLLLLLLFTVSQEAERGRLVWSPLWAGLLTLTRPEGFLAAAVVSGWLLLQKFWRKQKFTNWVWLLLPFVLFFAQSLFYRLATGQWGSNTFILKTWWYILTPSGHFSPLVNQVVNLLIVIFEFVPNALVYFANDLGLVLYLGLPVAFAGAVLARKEERKNSPFPLSVVWLTIFAIEFFAVLNIFFATEVTRRRYFIFLAPLSIFFTLLFFWRVGQYFSRRAVIVFFIVLSIFSWYSLRSFRQAYALDNQNIWQMHFQLARWVTQNVRPDEIIGMNDAGAIPYLTDRKIFDMMGLVTNQVAQVVHQGPEAWYQMMVNLPPDQRPDYYAIFPGWFIKYPLEPAHRQILKMFGPPIAHFTVSERTIVPYDTMSVFKSRYNE